VVEWLYLAAVQQFGAVAFADRHLRGAVVVCERPEEVALRPDSDRDGIETVGTDDQSVAHRRTSRGDGQCPPDASWRLTGARRAPGPRSECGVSERAEDATSFYP